MNTLALKRRRDMWRQKWQFIAVFVTVLLGVALFAGTFNAYLNLEESLDGSYERLVMADMTVTGAGEGFIDEVGAVEGVDAVMSRRRADVPFEIGDYSFVGRIIGFPTEGEPAINRIDIDEGSGLDAADPTGVVLETHAASDFGLGVGDVFSILGQDVEVVGIATSPEYLWPARDRQNVFTAPKSFAVVFADEAVLETDSPAVEHQVLIRYTAGIDVDDVDAAITSIAESAGAADVEPLSEQPSNATIHLEIGGLRTMAVALPVLFLAAAAMAIWVVITRLVFAQRGVIGTLRASGFTSRTMSNHYRVYGLTVGIVGAAVGAALGGLLARAMTAIYTAIFGIPDLVAPFHLPTVLMALVFGALAGVAAAVPPARTVAAMAPAEAMRGDVPLEGGRHSIFERLIPPLRKAPVRWRMSLRGIGRNKKRSTSMVVGVVLGMTLILASWGMLDTMLGAIDRQFNEVAIEDATVVFSEPVDGELVDAVTATEGVALTEAYIALQATVRHEGESFGTALEAYDAGTRVHGFAERLPATGVLLGQATEDILGVDEGDSVVIDLPGLEAQISTTVAGFVDEPLGTMAYMQTDALVAALDASDDAFSSEILAAPTFSSAKSLFDGGVDSPSVIAEVREVDGVAAVIDSNEIRELIEDFQVFFYVFIAMMIVFGGAMAFALIFNIISVNVAERSGEFASMRANGLTHRRVASLVVGETFLLTAIGIVPGLVAGYLAAVAFMNSFSSDQFPITAAISWFTMVGASVVMFVVAGLSLVPALRSVKRINVGEIVRERAT